jgi:pimeloyl-ACP methyl ester carboxylesterase
MRLDTAMQEDAARLVADAAHASTADYLPLPARDVSVAGFARALDVLGKSDGVAIAASVKQPMLIIVDAADQIAPLARHGRRLAAAAPRARLDIVERCGHLQHFEVPTVFDNLVRGFWQEMNNCG